MNDALQTDGKIISGLLVAFAKAEQNCNGYWWDDKTDFALEMFAPHPLFFVHGIDFLRHGTITSIVLHERGLHASAEVDENSFLHSMVQAGGAAWSSGSSPHMIEVDWETGYVSKWPIVEGSIAPVQMVCAKEGLTAAQSQAFSNRYYLGWSKMNKPESAPPAPPEPAPLQLNGQAAVSLPPEPEKSPVKINSLSVSSPYDRFSVLGMAAYWQMQTHLAQRLSRPFQPDNSFFRALGDKVKKLYDEFEDVDNRLEVSDKFLTLQNRPVSEQAWQAWHKRVPYLQANELMRTDLTGFGAELIPTLLASVAYYTTLLATEIWGLFDSFQMPSNPYEYPVISKGLTVYGMPEMKDQEQVNPGSTTAVPAPTRFGTSKVIFDAGKIGTRLFASQEEVDDSGIDFMQAAAIEFTRRMAFALDHTLINGDELKTVDNISNKGAIPADNQAILQVNGLRDMAAENTDTLDASSFDTDTITTLAQKMGNRGNLGREIAQLVCIVSPEVAYKLDKLDDYKTMDDVGDMATLIKGQIGSWKGVPVKVTEAVELGDAAGNIDATPASNTLGMFILAHRDVVKIGLRGELRFEQGPFLYSDSVFMWGSQRFDVQQLEAGGAAVGFNITV